MGRIALLLFGVFSIAFALGTGMGILIGRTRPIEDRVGAAVDPPAAGGEVVPAAPPRPAPRPAPEDPPIRAKDAGPGLSRFLASIPAEPAIRGEGAIRGTVRLESGEPLPGVLVRANRLHEERPTRRRPAGASAEPSLEEKLRQFVLDERRSEANRREAQSGEDGAFTLTGLPQASYWIEASREGYQIQRVERRGAYSARPGDQVDFVAKAILSVSVSVLLPDGTQAAQAQVMASSGGGRGRFDRQADWTPEDPAIELGPGTYRLQARDGDPGELASSSVEVTLEAGAPPPAVTLQLRGRPGIRGKVLFDPGDEFHQYGVRALRVRPNDPSDLEKLAEEGATSETRGENSEFVFNDLVPGTYLLGVSRGHGSGKILASELVEVTDQMVQRDLTLPPLGRSDYFVLRVSGPKGEVLGDVEIQTGVHREQGGASTGTAASVKRNDGSYLVLHRDWAGHSGEETQNTVIVQTEGYPPKTVEYQRSQTSEISVQFEEPATLEVTVEGYAPAAYLGTLRVRLEADRGDEGEDGERNRVRIRQASRFRRFRSNFDGEANNLTDGSSTFGPLEPGSYLVVLHYQVRDPGIPIAKLQVVVRPGRNAVAVPMPRLYPLKVLVSGASGNSTLYLTPTGAGQERWSISRQCGADGQAIFDGLPQGTYKVSRQDGEAGEMLVTVPGQSQVAFQASKLNAVQLTVTDAEGELARAGFQTGDLIVAVSGAAFEDQQEWRTLFNRVRKEKSASFLVARGGMTLEIHFEPRKLLEGGVLEPASR